MRQPRAESSSFSIKVYCGQKSSLSMPAFDSNTSTKHFSFVVVCKCLMPGLNSVQNVVFSYMSLSIICNHSVTPHRNNNKARTQFQSLPKPYCIEAVNGRTPQPKMQKQFGQWGKIKRHLEIDLVIYFDFRVH